MKPIGQEYATDDNELPYEPSLHVKGTIVTPKGRQFWLTIPRPAGVSIDDWEARQQEKWDKIFGRGNEND